MVADPAQQLLGFARFARAEGIQVGVGEVHDALRIADAGALLDRSSLYWALRALFCGNRNDWEAFDQLFKAYWGVGENAAKVNTTARQDPQAQQRLNVKSGGDSEAVEAGGEESQDDDSVYSARGSASYAERLSGTDFKDLMEGEEMDAVAALAERVGRRMRQRQTARWHTSCRGQVIDMRRTLRRSLACGGVPLRPVHIRRRQEPRPVVLLLDVSRSMQLYSFFFLRFARGLMGALPRADAFLFHTSLVPAGDALRQRSFHRTRELLAERSAGWGGGTRIGDSLAEFRRTHGRHVLKRRTVVIVVSDGLETGKADALGDQLRQIRRRVRRLVWLNPLMGRDSYEPTAAGMAAALPWLDLFAPAHNIESLANLEYRLTQL